VASGDNHLAMRCFEVVGDHLFVCFANGSMSIHSETTQAVVRKPFAAHVAEVKHVTRGHGPFLVTCCLDNQVRLQRWTA